MTVFTDFLTYKDGAYHRTDEAFKFNGQHIVKIVGWDKHAGDNDVWIIENSWGNDWGEDGYGKVLVSDKSTNLDAYSLGLAVYEYTMRDYYNMQEN